MRDFYGCYLLHSKHPNTKDRTYIGFTVNPRRRIKQHNGVIGAGAYKTSKWRPWEMQLVVYGFPTQVQALQFEWAWQHPAKSKAVRALATQLGTRGMTGVKGKMRLMLGMLNIPPWAYCPLTIQYLSTTAANTANSLQQQLPSHIKVITAPMEDLPTCVNDDDEEDDGASESVRHTSQLSLPSTSRDVTSSQATAKRSSKAAGKTATNSKAARNSKRAALLSPVMEEQGLDGGSRLQEHTVTNNDMQESESESDNESEGSDPEMLGLTPEQCLPPDWKQWRCDICEQPIERHVLHCSCRRGFHLQCLAAHWTLQETYDPLSDSGLPSLPNQAASSPAHGLMSTQSLSRTTHTLAPSTSTNKGRGKGKTKGRKGATGTAPCPEQETLPIPAQLPDRGCCPSCGKEHRWIDLLSKMIPYGYPMKPRVRRTRKRRALKAAVPKKTKDTADSSTGRKPKRKPAKAKAKSLASPTGAGNSNNRGAGCDAGMDMLDIDMTNMPTPKSTKRPKKKRVVAVISSDSEGAMAFEAPRRGRPRKVAVDISATDIIQASASPPAPVTRSRSSSKSHSLTGNDSDKNESGSVVAKLGRKSRGKAVSVINLSGTDLSDTEPNIKQPVSKKRSPSIAKTGKAIVVDNSATMPESPTALIVSGKTRKRQQTSKAVNPAALPAQDTQHVSEERVSLLPLAERLRVRLLNQQVSQSAAFGSNQRQPDAHTATDVQSTGPVQATSSVSDMQCNSRGCGVESFLQHGVDACVGVPQARMQVQTTCNGYPPPAIANTCLSDPQAAINMSEENFDPQLPMHNQDFVGNGAALDQGSSQSDVLTDKTGMLNMPPPSHTAPALVCSGGGWANTTPLGRHIHVGASSTTPYNPTWTPAVNEPGTTTKSPRPLSSHMPCNITGTFTLKPSNAPSKQPPSNAMLSACSYSRDGPAAMQQPSCSLPPHNQQHSGHGKQPHADIKADDTYCLPYGAHNSEGMFSPSRILEAATWHAVPTVNDTFGKFVPQENLTGANQDVLHASEGYGNDVCILEKTGSFLNVDKPVVVQDGIHQASTIEHQCTDKQPDTSAQLQLCNVRCCEHSVDCLDCESPLTCQPAVGHTSTYFHHCIDRSSVIDLTETPGFHALHGSRPMQACSLGRDAPQESYVMHGKDNADCQVICLDDDDEHHD